MVSIVSWLKGGLGLKVQCIFGTSYGRRNPSLSTRCSIFLSDSTDVADVSTAGVARGSFPGTS